jgi:hypothetical protein
MTTLEARGDRDYVRALALMTGKYATLGALFVVVPLWVETEGVLQLWLGSVPPGSAFFVRLAMLWLTIHALSAGFDRAAFARGELKTYALATTAVSLVSLLVCCVALFGFDAGPWVVPTMMLVAAFAQIPVRVGHVGRLIHVGYASWLRDTVLPTFVPAAAGALAAVLVHAAMAEGWPRYGAVGVAYAVVACPLIWLISVGEREKRSLRRLAASALSSTTTRR